MKTIKEREKRSLAQAVLWTDRNSMVVQRRSQMTSHSNGSQSKYPVSLSARLSISLCLSVSLSLAAFCHNPSYVTPSWCTWSFLWQSILCLQGANVFRLSERSEWQDLTVRGRLFPQISTRQWYACFEYDDPWPGKLRSEFLGVE